MEAESLSKTAVVEPEGDRGGMASSVRCSFEPVSVESLAESDFKLRKIEYGDWIDVEPKQE